MSPATAPQALNPSQALQSGADLWVVSPPELSTWSRQIDWYLNFQISRGLRNQSRPRPAQISHLLQQIQWDLPEQFLDESQSLLISSLRRLPTPWVYLTTEWDREGQFLAPLMGLKPRVLRLFPPTGIPTHGFKLNSEISLEIVTES